MNQDPNITDAGGSPEETPEQIQTRLRTHADNYWTLRNKLILITTATSTMGLLVSLFSLMVAISFAFKQHNLREHDLRTQQELREKDLSKQQELREQDFDRAWSLKEIDMRQYCQKRYDDLAYDTKAKVKTDNDAKGYYKAILGSAI